MQGPMAELVLRQGGVLLEDQTVEDLLVRITERIETTERRWSDCRIAARLAQAVAEDIRAGRCVFGSPVLTNIWAEGRPLASCTAVPTTDRGGFDLDKVRARAEVSYRDNMGSGFTLDQAPSPVGALVALNGHAQAFEDGGNCERYVGNMGMLSWDHPEIADFVLAKTRRHLPHFNLSVRFDRAGEAAFRRGDGSIRRLVGMAAEAAWSCGDPGLVFVNRYQDKNPLADLSPYVTTAPCAEMGLAEGDTCLFGYLSLPAHLSRHGVLDLDLLGATTRHLTRALDGLIDASAPHLPGPAAGLALAKRRVGVALCGFADALVLLGCEYGDPSSLGLLEDALAVVQHEAVSESQGPGRSRPKGPARLGGGRDRLASPS